MQQWDADIICIQETKAQPHQLNSNPFCPKDYHCFYHDADKKGCNGVALFCRKQPANIISGMGWQDANSEDRFIEAQFENLSIISLYLPSGTSREDRQSFKFKFMDHFTSYLEEYSQNDRGYIICGDWNMAHKEIDLKNWRGNQKNQAFYLRKEPGWIDCLLMTTDWIYLDSLIRMPNNTPDGQSCAKNVGWRIPRAYK